jgi:hypothetical protein
MKKSELAGQEGSFDVSCVAAPGKENPQAEAHLPNCRDLRLLCCIALYGQRSDQGGEVREGAFRLVEQRQRFPKV